MKEEIIKEIVNKLIAERNDVSQKLYCTIESSRDSRNAILESIKSIDRAIAEICKSFLTKAGE